MFSVTITLFSVLLCPFFMLASLFWFESSPSHFVTYIPRLIRFLFVVVLMHTVQCDALCHLSASLFSLPIECEFKCVCQSLSRV